MSVSPSNSSCSPQTQRDSSRQTARTGSEVKVVFPLCMTQTTSVHCSILCRGLMDTGEDCCFVTMCLQALISDRGKDKELGSTSDCLFALPEVLFSFFHHLPLTPPPPNHSSPNPATPLHVFSLRLVLTRPCAVVMTLKSKC